MARRLSLTVCDTVAANWSGAGTNYIVHANNGSVYIVYVDAASDVCFRKSSDGGKTWGPAVLAATAGTTTQLSVWYDRWTDPTGALGDYIHIALTDSGNDDTMYRTINTASSDALSTQTVIFAGASTAAGNHLSITRAKGGNVYCKTVIDAGAEGGFYRLPTANVPSGAWDAARTVDEAIATLDQMILLPDYDAADTQDIMAIFWDASADEISRKLYDDSANTWSEASIATSMTELGTGTAFPNFDVAPDPTNTRHILVAWSATDAANADLRCWTVDSGSISEVTNVVLNSTDDQGLCAIGIDTATGYWHVFYGGKSDGSETWNTAMNIYTKVSTDSGSTWGPETKLTASTTETATLRHLITSPRFTGPSIVAFVRDGAQTDDLRVNIDHTEPRALSAAGVV
jgi:hypothetical protein